MTRYLLLCLFFLAVSCGQVFAEAEALLAGLEENAVETNEPKILDSQSTDTASQTRSNLADTIKSKKQPTKDDFSPTQLYKKISRSVIEVRAYNDKREHVGSGTGFFISEGGLVATNLHVISGASHVSAHWQEKSYSPTGVVGFDRENDLAILKVAGDSFPPLTLEIEMPPIASRVYAIGNPKGFTNSFSEGIVSGHRKETTGRILIQTTAAISPGSSGGPLISSSGKVVGITTLVYLGGQNLNFAVPASQLAKLMSEAHKPLSMAALNKQLGQVRHRQIAIEDDPEMLSSVWTAVKEKELGTALRELSKIPTSRQGYGYWMAAGHVHYLLGNLPDSTRSYTKAVEHNLTSVEGKLRLAFILSFPIDSDIGKTNRARELCRELSKDVFTLDPTNARAYNIYASNSIYSPAEDIGFFKTAVSLDPSHAGAWYNMGLVYLRTQSNDLALKAFRSALKLKAQFDQYQLIPHDSLDLVSSVTSTDSMEVMVQLGIATAYNRMDKYPQAIREYKKVLRIEPNNAVAQFGLQMCYRGWKGPRDSNTLYWEKHSRVNMTAVLFGSRAPKIAHFDTR